MIKNLLIKGNRKMGPEVYLFNLPPVQTCTPTDWCLHGKNGKPACYALGGNFVFENVKRGSFERLEASKKPDFVDRMSQEIVHAKVKYFRFHASGDFYSEEYVGKVMSIASRFPEVSFRTTTRRRDLKEAILELDSLPNFIVRESLDSCRSEPVTGLPFAALDFLDVVRAGDSYLCQNDCKACGYHCWAAKTNMHFAQH